jgi:DHA1 family bicyclomycin/chloramphenicol resistance-like MFS transporter
MLHPRSPGVAALVLMLVIMPVVAMDLQFAAMPDIGRALNAPVAAVGVTLSAFAGVFGVLQLIYGPVSDRLGRKGFIVGGMVLFGVASIGAVLSTSIEMLTVMRVLQAVGVCAGPVLGRAVIRDVHGPQGAARMLGYVMGGFGIIAITGPFLGGVLVDVFDWRAPFIAMAGIGFVAALLCWLWLPETRPEADDGARPSAGTLLRTFGTLLRNRQVLVFMVTGGLMQGAMFAWLAGSSFILINVFGYSGMAYGLILPITVAGFTVASFASGKLAGRFGLHRLIVPGLLLATGSAIVAVGLALAGYNALWAVLIPATGVSIGHGFTLSSSAAGAMAAYPQHAGAASALAGFFQYLGVMGSVALIGTVFDGSALPVLVVICGFAVAAALVFIPNVRVFSATETGNGQTS